MKKRRWNNWYMLKIAAQTSPAFVLWTLVKGALDGCVCAVTEVIFLRVLFNLIGAGAAFREILLRVGLMGLFYLAVYFLRELGEKRIAPLAEQSLHQNLQRKLFQKAREMDLEQYDDPSFYNDFVWAMGEADQRVVAVMASIGRVVEMVLSTAMLLAVLLDIDPLLVPMVLVTLPVVLWLKSKVVKEQLKRDEEQRPFLRRQEYIDRVFRLPEYAKEIKLSEVDQLLLQDYGESGDAYRRVVRRRGKRMTVFYSLQRIAGDLMNYAGVMLLLCYKALVAKTLPLGDFAASINGFWRVFNQLSDLVECSAEFREHSLYIEKFRRFLDSQPSILENSQAGEARQMESLRLEHVSYAYPSGEKAVVQDVSLEIKPGERIALVGVNGAGKTTLVKLLCRLYDPTEGRVLWNGVDAKAYALDSYRGQFSAMFQDYRLFAASVKENVVAGLYQDEDSQRVTAALEESGFAKKLPALPKGADSQLTREFDPDGALLSGGEAQKLVVARTLAKPCGIFIFDEASSALDPFAEYELNQAMMAAAKDKAVIFISHRLATAKLVDRIYLLDQGRIAETGSHEELMALGGKYAEMFRIQAEQYN